MLFSFYGLDDPQKSILRTQLLSIHREYLNKFSNRIAFAGPLLADDEATVVGSLLVLEFDVRADGEKFIAEEPYQCAGLYESMKIQVFRNRWPQKVGFPVI